MKHTLLFMASVLAAGCGTDGDDGHEHHAGPHDWSYHGENGPMFWGDIPGYMSCRDGEHKSPLELPEDLPAEDLSDLRLDYRSSGVSIINSGHGIQYDYDPGSKLHIGDDTYDLLQFHFHAPSEHILDGKQYPMEVHLVHRASDGELAVLGTFIEEGPEHQMLIDAAWQHLPAEPGDTHTDDDAMFNASELVPGGDSYRYTGSLTTPPCTEGIAWQVFAQPITLSAEQIQAFTKIYADNYRPLQMSQSSMLRFGR